MRPALPIAGPRAAFAAIALAIAASPAAALDSCAIGVWEADANDIAHLMATTMNGTAEHVSGTAHMVITADGIAEIIANNLTINVVVAGTPPIEVVVTGYSRGLFEADGGAWRYSTVDFELIGSADVLGQRMTIPITSDTGMFGNAEGIYGCSETSMSFDAGDDLPRFPRRWTRVG
ncbi:hypothetical protein [Pseudoroseicyclus sp. CXY001]|uniref:hypothetical protein n=1 Tax=Pseudoroseicyclus sp. CXY001 TaxID=3242492 RepID=UPI0035713865